MAPGFLLATYCILIVLGSLAGGWLPSLVRLTHTRLQLVMSFVSGLMLGIAFLHFLPHSTEYLHSIVSVAGWMLGGLLVMFFLLRLFHVHHYEDEDSACDDHHHDHGHAHESDGSSRRISWIGTFFGLAVHTLLDGVVLGAAVMAESHGQASVGFVAFGVFLAVLLHKPLDALSITALMRAGGWSSGSRRVVNGLFAVMCPLGAVLFCLGVSAQSETRDLFVGAALAFSGGFFICIALGDLLPEVQFHSHDRGKLSLALLAGVVLAVAIESTHSHGHDHSHPDGRLTPDDSRRVQDEDAHHGHDHSGHDHGRHKDDKHSRSGHDQDAP